MSLESTIVCVDCSDFMRNGDFLPTRLQAQQDAVYLVCRAKARAHPQNDVGLVTLARVRVVVTLTSDVGKVLVELGRLTPNGDPDFRTGLSVAQLVLRHRQEKSHRTRIVAFVGSPISQSNEELVALAKKLKKEKVSVDVVSFGEEAEAANGELLSTFIDTLNGKQGGSSHLLTVPRGPTLTVALLSSPIVLGEDGSLVVPEDVYGSDFDVEEDPELALALQMSLAEQRRLEAQQEKSNQQLSKEVGAKPNPAHMTEEEQIAFAIQMSMMNKSPDQSENEPATLENEDLLGDTEFLKALLSELEHLEEESEDDVKETKKDK